jgi:hypothetical protein
MVVCNNSQIQNFAKREIHFILGSAVCAQEDENKKLVKLNIKKYVGG